MKCATYVYCKLAQGCSSWSPYTPIEHYMPYKGKMQYVLISDIINTSIKHAISGQSIPMMKGRMDIMFDMVDTAFSHWRVLIVC